MDLLYTLKFEKFNGYSKDTSLRTVLETSYGNKEYLTFFHNFLYFR